MFRRYGNVIHGKIAEYSLESDVPYGQRGIRKQCRALLSRVNHSSATWKAPDFRKRLGHTVIQRSGTRASNSNN